MARAMRRASCVLTPLASLASLALLLVGAPAPIDAKQRRVPFVYCDQTPANETVYDYSAMDIHGVNNVSMADFRGKSEFGNNFVALGFPCNQFELQEPGNNASEILNGVKYVRPGNGFEPNFKMFSKIEVNGENEHPLYSYLKSRCPSTRNYFSDKASLTYNRFEHSDVRWNWEKFLIGKDGYPVKRYDASTDPTKIKGDIQRLMRSN